MRQRRAERGQDPGLLCTLFPAAFFLLGVVAGGVYAGRMPDDVGAELSAYLHTYLAFAQGQKVTAGTVCALVWAYTRWSVCAFFCGFTSVGMVLLPLAAAAFGFFSAYAVGCLVAAFGSGGIWAAFALFGLRSCVTVPCFFLVAAHAWCLSAALFRVSFGRGHPFSPVYDRSWWLSLVWVCVCLFVGICVDLRLSPWLLQVLAQRIF